MRSRLHKYQWKFKKATNEKEKPEYVGCCFCVAGLTEGTSPNFTDHSLLHSPHIGLLPSERKSKLKVLSVCQNAHSCIHQITGADRCHASSNRCQKVEKSLERSHRSPLLSLAREVGALDMLEGASGDPRSADAPVVAPDLSETHQMLFKTTGDSRT